jgi:hypothetical protein
MPGSHRLDRAPGQPFCKKHPETIGGSQRKRAPKVPVEWEEFCVLPTRQSNNRTRANVSYRVGCRFKEVLHVRKSATDFCASVSVAGYVSMHGDRVIEAIIVSFSLIFVGGVFAIAAGVRVVFLIAVCRKY